MKKTIFIVAMWLGWNVSIAAPAWPDSDASSFLSAAKTCNAPVLDNYIASGASLDVAYPELYNGKGALTLTMEGNCDAYFNVLLMNGANVNAQDMNGRTPLMNAILHRANISYIKALAHHPEANLMLEDRFGNTAIDMAKNLYQDAVRNIEVFRVQNVNHQYQYNGFEHKIDIQQLNADARYAKSVLKLVAMATEGMQDSQ